MKTFSLFFLAILAIAIGVIGANADDSAGATSVSSSTKASSTPSNTGTPAATTGSAPPLQLGETEAQQRHDIPTSDFSTNFAGLPNTGGAYADARYVLGQTSPALFTLPRDGLAQGVITLKACALFSPHHHPRASEVIYVAQGTVNVSFVEENPVTLMNGVTVGGRILNFTLNTGANVVIPQALLHFVYNPTCNNSTLVTSFDNRDPGTVSIVQSLFRFDTTVIQAATGLQGQLQDAVRSISNGTSIIGVDSDCLARCNAGQPQTTSGRRMNR